jgi:hypothetical protein
MIAEVEQLVTEIETLDLEGLRNVWREHYGAPPPLRSTLILRQLLAFRVQAQVMDGLDAETRKALARSGPVQAETEPMHGLPETPLTRANRLTIASSLPTNAAPSRSSIPANS